jgi:leucyl aminopeptidase
MQRRLPYRLQLLVPAVENAIAGNAFRPGDVVRTRAGHTVEIGNTDAEGRVILCDALAYAAEEKPRTLIDFATLTGAARVALGPELPAMFANDEKLAEKLLAASEAVEDPLWRMPLWRGYRRLFDSDIADFSNSGKGGFGGAIVAALFLEWFVPDTLAWAHFDTFAWNDISRPGRPAGGEALGLRAALAALE